MYRYWTAQIMLVVLLTACQSSPGNLSVPKEQMVDVLIDVHTAEAAISYLFGEKRDSFARQYYQEIYTIHGLTEAEFDQAMQELRQDHLLMAEVYRQVLEKVETQVPD